MILLLDHCTQNAMFTATDAVLGLQKEPSGDTCKKGSCRKQRSHAPEVFQVCLRQNGDRSQQQ